MKEEYDELKEMYIEHIFKYVDETGEIFPHFTVFAKHKYVDKDVPEKALLHIPIADEYISDATKKKELVESIMPYAIKDIKSKFDIMAIGWCSEVWMREAKEKKDLVNLDDLPIRKEAIIMSFETEQNKEFLLYEIKRNGMKITEDGITDQIELVKLDNLDGADQIVGVFTNLYKKFKV